MSIINMELFKYGIVNPYIDWINKKFSNDIKNIELIDEKEGVQIKIWGIKEDYYPMVRIYISPFTMPVSTIDVRWSSGSEAWASRVLLRHLLWKMYLKLCTEYIGRDFLGTESADKHILSYINDIKEIPIQDHVGEITEEDLKI